MEVYWLTHVFGWKRIGSGEDVAEVGVEKNVKEKKKSRGNGKKMLPLQLK